MRATVTDLGPPRSASRTAFSLVALLGALTPVLLTGCSGERPRPPRPSGPPNLLLVTLDTTRASHLGLYLYDRDTSPNIDRLAAEAMVYERAYSTSSWTLPAHASLFTGRFPTSHGAMHNPAGSLILGDELHDGELAKFRADPLAPDQQTLAEILRANGYVTGAVVGGPWLLRAFGLDRGFDHYDDVGANLAQGRRAADVSDAALPWIEEHAAEPFFLFLNYFDPHSPYQDPEGLDRMFETRPGSVQPPGAERFVERYDGEIRYMDRHFGRVLDRLRELGLYDVSWIVVTGDHGEMLGEHEIHGHGGSLWEEEVRVPLIVKPPADRLAPGRSRAMVRLVDVLPLVLEGLGLAVPPQVQGSATPGADPVFAELHPWRRDGTQWHAWYEGDFKLLRHSQGWRMLFNVVSDPGETFDLKRYEPERLDAMSAALSAFADQLPTPTTEAAPRAIDEETRRALENLGYTD
jgi:arylsulfatase A-like enzyme